MRRARDPRLTACATIVAAFLLHQVRYLLEPDPAAAAGHRYLAFAPPLLAGVASVFVALALSRAAARAAGAPGRAQGRTAGWLWCTLALLAILGLQELAEGHVAALAGHGGWIAVPLAVPLGWGLSRFLWRTEDAIAWVAGRLRRGARAARLLVGSAPPAVTIATPLLPLPGRLTRPGAGRAPPAWTR